jgi:hypothetical protein
MIDRIKKFILSIIPVSIERKYFVLKESIRYRSLKKEILDYYQNLENITQEEREMIAYLKKHPIAVLLYYFVNDYSLKKIKVHKDNQNGLLYVLHDNKRLYFKRSLSKNDVQAIYYGLQIEQDLRSPHLYLTSDFNIDQGEVMADVGSAEGILALSAIEKVKKVYLFEVNPEWIEALDATFKPWKEKVSIINKFVSNKNDDTHVTLDSIFYEENPLDFIKIDVDGAEKDLLDGADNLLKNRKNLKIALCTYHKQNDAEEFEKLLQEKGFQTEFSKGFMLFYKDKNIAPPYFRRGLIRATKSKEV